MNDTDPADCPRYGPESRESIWSVEREHLALYSVLFPCGWVIGIVYSVIRWVVAEKGFWVGVDMLVTQIGIAGLSSAIFALMVIAVKGELMPLFNRRQRQLEAAEARGRQTGQQEADKKWRDWYEHEKANGSRFEDPPSLNDVSQEARRE